MSKAKVLASAAGVGSSSTHVATPQQTIDPVAVPEVAETITEEEIRRRAYAYWEGRAADAGSPEEDWYRAIEDICREREQTLNSRE